MWSLNVLGGSLTGQIAISQIIHQNQQDIRAIRQPLFVRKLRKKPIRKPLLVYIYSSNLVFLNVPLHHITYGRLDLHSFLMFLTGLDQ